MGNDRIVRKEINGAIKWVFEEENYDGWGGFSYIKEFPFDTYYDAEHCARLRSKNEKYKSSFTRTYDKYGNETFKDDDVVFSIITPSSNEYWELFNLNREIDMECAKYNKSFWYRLRRFFHKPSTEKYDLPLTTVEMKIGPKETIKIFEGKDWGEAKKYISEFVKKKSLYNVKNGNTLSD